MKEFHNYHEQHSTSHQYRTSSTMDDSHLLLNHPHHGDLMSGVAIDDNTAYMYDVDFGGVIQSRTQTTLLQHNLGPPDLPPLYQPQHRASI